MAKYIDEKDFSDFKQNFHTLVDIFNHNITELKDDFKDLRDDVKKICDKDTNKEEKIYLIANDLSELKGSTKVNNKLLWTLFGIIVAIVTSAILATI